MRRILVTGALGQIGSELVVALRERYGREAVIASDIRMPPLETLHPGERFEFLDSTNARQIQDTVRNGDVGTIYHLAALLSATSEEKPHVAWELNMGGLYKVLEVARQHDCQVFFPSSIGAFGPGTPKDNTPQDTIQRPSTMYGVTKVAGELLCDYYNRRFGVDTRGLRFPGLISYATPPGGGTTDYAVAIFYDAIRYGKYTCFLKPDTRLDMMYMPDALAALVTLMEADPGRLIHRNSFNVTAMNFTPEELVAAIRKHIPAFEMRYEIDPVRQGIADSWPNSLDCSAARAEWGFSPRFGLEAMVEDMLTQLRARIS
ncbi:MAG: L-threonine 3-dehydrogenase [Vicinamibacteria bacterium]|jgi:nucleoside-diphosphate-sugar epimerase|nr:L-threonine 3-dehydrogenase [Vicinamibacteria bacterium]MBP9945170.1 L-threonine 3-dehydrogenase [Vicinamibacteria bacterium]